MGIQRAIIEWFKVRDHRDTIRLTLFFTLFTMAIPLFTILSVSYVIYGELTSLNASLMWIGILIPLFIVPPIGIALLNMLRLLGKSLKRLDAVVKIDPLTGVLTRLFFLTTLHEKQEDSGVFLMIDIDRFKLINDNFGHQNGDVVLKKVAQSLAKSCAGNHSVGRLGGEEFGIFLSGYDLEDGVQFAWDICENVRETRINVNDTRLKVTISIGAAFHEPNVQFEKTMRTADYYLYNSKSQGRDCVTSQVTVRDRKFKGKNLFGPVEERKITAIPV